MTNQKLLTEKITEIVASALSENDIKPRVKEILEVLDETRYAGYLSGIRKVVKWIKSERKCKYINDVTYYPVFEQALIIKCKEWERRKE
jgi:hypothetical protein